TGRPAGPRRRTPPSAGRTGRMWPCLLLPPGGLGEAGGGRTSAAARLVPTPADVREAPTLRPTYDAVVRIPGGGTHVDPVPAHRRPLGEQPATGAFLVPAADPSVRGDHPVPGHRTAVPGHDRADAPRRPPAGPVGQRVGDGAVAHDPPRWDPLHQVEHGLRVLLGAHAGSAAPAGPAVRPAATGRHGWSAYGRRPPG